MSYLCDIDGDGRDEVLALTDGAAAQGPVRNLLVYQLDPGCTAFTAVASLEFPTGFIPVEFLGVRRLKDRRQILLRFADPARCSDDAVKYGRSSSKCGGVDFRDGSLTISWMDDALDFQLEFAVADLDGDGEDEVRFTPLPWPGLPERPALTSPLLLKGIRTFTILKSHF